MLTRPHRLTTSRGFSTAVRHGRRAGTTTVVVHLLAPPVGDSSASDGPAQVGFVVGKAVGPAVTRNLVKRRLRALARERVSSLPRSSTLVVRALPPAADASYAALGGDLDRALTRSMRSSKRSRREDAN
jgi:ribonuclease P protein component